MKWKFAKTKDQLEEAYMVLEKACRIEPFDEDLNKNLKGCRQDLKLMEESIQAAT